MFCDNAGRRPVGSGGLSRFWEKNPILIDWHTCDLSPGDLGCVSLKEVREEFLLQHVLHGLERLHNVWGNALHEISLLMEGLLQSHIGSLRVFARHSGHDINRRFPHLHPLLDPPILHRLYPHKSPQISAARPNLQEISTKEGLRLRNVMWRRDQDSLGQLREISSQGISCHQVIQVHPNS